MPLSHARIIAIWALAESGLGGILHAFKIPFTGIIVGGCSVLCITLLAVFSDKPKITILRATGIVLAVKLLASPHTSFQAYLAVSFQALVGIALSGYLRQRPFLIAFAVIAMLESALQKVLVLTLIFGNNLWSAIDFAANAIRKDFGFASDFSASYWLIIGYTTIYLVWGVLLGNWMYNLLQTLDEKTQQYRHLCFDLVQNNHPKRRFKLQKVLFFVILLLSILVYVLTISQKSVGFYLLRVFLVLLFFNFFLTPFIRWIIQRQSQKYGVQIQATFAQLPYLKNLAFSIFDYCKKNYSGWKVISRFGNIFLTKTIFQSSETKVFIFSQPIRTGKTSTLQKWITTQGEVAGFLTPEIENKRFLYFIDCQQKTILSAPEDMSANDVMEVGKFVFLKSAFQEAQTYLQALDISKHKWIVIDEIGKLELNDAGFEPVLSSFIFKYYQHPTPPKLILVVRDTLVSDVISKYHLHQYQVIDADFFE